MDTDDSLVPTFIPSLAAILANAERRKGSPLIEEEVIEIRDTSNCIMIPEALVRKMEETRGYRDIDPESCWEEWQRLRDELAEEDGDA